MKITKLTPIAEVRNYLSWLNFLKKETEIIKKRFFDTENELVIINNEYMLAKDAINIKI